MHEETKTADRWKRSAKNFEADVLQRCTRWSRSCCAPCARQCNRGMSEAEYVAVALGLGAAPRAKPCAWYADSVCGTARLRLCGATHQVRCPGAHA